VVGLALVRPADRDPLRASTSGVGRLVREALDAGAREIFVALGGTGTVDGGAGMMAALGVRFLGEDGGELPPVPQALEALSRVDTSTLAPALAGARLVGLVDVDVPLLGPAGARMFMRQKGASDEAMDRLEAVLARLHPLEIARMPGAGAAGGLGAAILRLGGTLVPGSRFVLDALHLEERVAAADLVFSGEGRIDEQTVHGKALSAVAQACKRHGKPLVAFCGQARGHLTELREAGVSEVVEITPPGQGMDEALARGDENLRAACGRVLDAVASGGSPKA
jgi:glycerate kinase